MDVNVISVTLFSLIKVFKIRLIHFPAASLGSAMMSWRTVISAAQLATLALGALRSALHTGGTKYRSRAVLCKWLFTLFNKLLYRGEHVSVMLLHYGLLQMTTGEILWGGEILCANDALVSVISKLILWISVCRGFSAGQYIQTKGLGHNYVNIVFGKEARHAAGQRRGYRDSLRTGRSGDRIPMASTFSVPVLTDPEAHNGYRGFSGVKRPGRDADNLPSSVTGVANGLLLFPALSFCNCIGMSWGDFNKFKYQVSQ